MHPYKIKVDSVIGNSTFIFYYLKIKEFLLMNTQLSSHNKKTNNSTFNALFDFKNKTITPLGVKV